MTDYQQGKIYRLYSPSRADVGVYYGSTVQKLYQRLCGHKAKKKCSSISIIEIEDAVIELVEDFPCNNKKELEAREYWFIQNNECVNKNKGDFNRKKYIKEYNEKNREELKEKRKEFYEKNREEVNRKNREYSEKNREKNKEYCKEFYEKNKEEILRKQKERREKNKEEILRKQKERRAKAKQTSETVDLAL
jgi:hypothetical protein